jgi:hypothetical protein
MTPQQRRQQLLDLRADLARQLADIDQAWEPLNARYKQLQAQRESLSCQGSALDDALAHFGVAQDDVIQGIAVPDEIPF